MFESNGPILITGVNGQVGGQLLPLLRQLGKIIAPTRAELDLTDAEAIRQFVRQIRPRWIVNPAAYTAVDKAEQEAPLAYAINSDAPRILGEEAAAFGVPVLHFSTDYVFAGDGTKPWSETDESRPLGVYGASKLAGERALAATGAAHIIFRTSWVYGSHGKNFLTTILHLARERDELKIVADQYGAPTWSRDLARLTMHTIGLCESQATASGKALTAVVDPISGIYHACDAGLTTWYGFASEFVRLAKASEPESRFARLMPIATEEYPTPTQRPKNSRLNCDRLRRDLGFTMPHWKESTAQVMAEVLPT